jgi:spermidine/putrescine transport system substrate-binding protein
LIIGIVRVVTAESSLDKKSNELNVYIWSNLLNVESIQEFEKKHKIKVNFHFYGTNEELISKLKLNGRSSADILFPSDYACKILIENQFLQKIDKSRLENFDNIFPFLLDKDFDPNNNYSIPYVWESYGFAYDPSLIKKKLSIKDLFDPPCKIATTPDPIESVSIAAYHLFNGKTNFLENEMEEITNLLIKQKKHVEAYADFRAKDLVASKNIPLSFIKTSLIDALKNENPNIEFSLPKDIVFTTIENVVICKDSKNLDNAYLFLNYIFQPEIMAQAIDQFPLFPSTSKTLELLPDFCPAYLETMYQVRKRKQDIRFFYMVTDNDSIRKMFLKTKV